jgi:hypothetical protein
MVVLGCGKEWGEAMLFKLFLLNINLQNIGYNIFPLENYMTKINLIER